MTSQIKNKNWKRQEFLFEEEYHLAPSQETDCAEVQLEEGQREGSGLIESPFLHPLEGRREGG